MAVGALKHREGMTAKTLINVGRDVKCVALYQCLHSCWLTEFAHDVMPIEPRVVILKYLEMLVGDKIFLDAAQMKVETCPGPEELGMYKDHIRHWLVEKLKR